MYPNLLSLLCLMPPCCGAMFGCETQLCCFVVWSYPVLCPAFQWLLSKHTQEMKALSPCTHCEWSFVLLESSRDSKGRARWLVSLSTVRSDMAWNIKHIKPVNNLTTCRSSLHCTGISWEVSEAACKSLGREYSDVLAWSYCLCVCKYWATKSKEQFAIDNTLLQ